MKKTIKIFFLFIFIFTPKIVKAREICEFDQKSRIQKIATNITTSYEYSETIADKEGEYNQALFTVKISNMHNDVRIINEATGEIYNNTPSGEIILENQKPGDYLKFVIASNISDCYNDRLLTIYVTLPNFNKYYTDPVCSKVPNYKLCNKWANVNLTPKQFKKNIDDYIQSLETKPDDETTIIDISLFEKIISFLAEYSLIIFGSVIIICAGLIYYLTKKDDFDLSL